MILTIDAPADGRLTLDIALAHRQVVRHGWRGSARHCQASMICIWSAPTEIAISTSVWFNRISRASSSHQFRKAGLKFPVTRKNVAGIS
jgi:hypothetical protein